MSEGNASEMEQVSEFFANYQAARKAIVEKEQGKRGVMGFIECPVCKKRLGYAIAKRNGHIHARCETADCMVWME